MVEDILLLFKSLKKTKKTQLWAELGIVAAIFLQVWEGFFLGHWIVEKRPPKPGTPKTGIQNLDEVAKLGKLFDFHVNL